MRRRGKRKGLSFRRLEVPVSVLSKGDTLRGLEGGQEGVTREVWVP